MESEAKDTQPLGQQLEQGQEQQQDDRMRVINFKSLCILTQFKSI